LKTNNFIAYFFLSLSFLCSFYFVRNNDTLYLFFYSFFLLCLFFTSLVYINKTSIKNLLSFIHFFRYLFIFYVSNFFLQAFYHKIEISSLILSTTNSFSAILSLFLFSSLINSKNDFLKLNRFIFYLLNISLIVGILNSLKIINFDFLAPSKLINNYSYGIFGNTSGLMEHPISFGIAGTILFTISVLLKKIKIKNLPYLLIIFLGVFISFSRTAFLILTVCFFTFLVYKKIISKISILMVLLGLFLLFFFIDLTTIPFLSNVLRLERVLSGREYIISFLLLIPWNYSDIIFGFGYQNLLQIRESILTDIEFNMAALQFESLHNLYLSTIGNSGILLALIYFISQIKIYYNHIRIKSEFSLHILMVMLIFILGNFFVEFKVGGLRIISLYFSMMLAFIYKYEHKKFNEI